MRNILFEQQKSFIKKAFLFLFSILISAQYLQANEDYYNISIQVKGIKNDTGILAYYYENNKYIQDTLYFNEKGIANIKGKKSYGNGVYLIAFPKLNYKYFDIILKETHFSLSTDTSNLALKMKVTNSLENKAMYDDMHFAIPNGQKLDSLKKVLNKTNPEDKNYTLLKNTIENNAENIRKHRIDIVKKYPNTFYASLLNIMLSPLVPIEQIEGKEWKDTIQTVEYIKENYFNIINFSDSGYVRTPIFKNYLNQYFDSYIFPVPDSIIQDLDILIKKAELGSPLMYRYILNTLYDKYSKSQIMGYDKIFVHLAENYYLNGKTPWSDEENLKKVKSYVEDIKPTLIDNIAPNFYFKDSNLVDYNFYKLLDNNAYTLLIFWNSDCGHCQKEIPLLKGIYDTLKNLDVQIVSISTEQTDSTFIKFAKENCHQNWIIGWDPNGTSAFRREYNVVTTPRIFIIDRNEKKIRAKNLPTIDVYSYIQFLIRKSNR
jgi:thiol-disulfide isomerase/thioredoxin